MSQVSLGDGVTLYTSDEWRTPAHQPTSVTKRPNGTRSITEFFQHHSGGATLAAADTRRWLRAIYDYHVHVRGYADIAYNMAVRDGTVWELRAGDVVGAHTLGHNTTGYGSCYLREVGNPFDARDKVAMRKVFHLTEFAAGRTLPAYGHRDVGQTECPGDDVYAWVHAGGLSNRGPVGTVPAGDGVPAFPGTMRLGSQGEGVRELQAQFARRGWRIDVDGEFGPRTETVVRAFQRDKGLGVDGVVGPVTWAAAFMSRVT